MATSSLLLHHFILFLSLLFLLSNAAQTSFRPRGLVLPVTKNPSILQYLTIINQRTPVTVDLGRKALWVGCEEFYNSTSYVPARCRSAQCSLAGSKSCSSGTCSNFTGPGCYDNTCSIAINVDANNVTYGSFGELGQDVFSIQSTDGNNPGPLVTFSRYLFSCADPDILRLLPSGVRGLAGLGREPVGLPSQLAAAFSFKRKFAICLPSSISASGVIFFGDGPYVMLPNVDVSTSLVYTPLLINPVSTESSYFVGEKSTEYFIGVKSIKVNGKAISLNTTLLSIQSNGYGGTKISTVDPYTVLQTSIYKSVTEAFVREAKYLTRVAAVAPFQVCFSSKNVSSTRVGPGVPSIDLVLQSESIYWRIFGANSMVQVRNGVLCLGFVDGGSDPRTSIVVGAHQLEDNLLQFDLATSRLGFSSSLLFRRTTCSNFNFTSTA